MFSQLWHTGRSSHSDNQDGNTPVSASVEGVALILDIDLKLHEQPFVADEVSIL